MNYGRLVVGQHDRCAAFRINHEENARVALLTAEEVRGLIGELQRMLPDLEAAPADADLLADLLS